MVEPERPLLPVSHSGRQVHDLVHGRVLEHEALLSQGQMDREQSGDRQDCTQPPAAVRRFVAGDCAGPGRFLQSAAPWISLFRSEFVTAGRLFLGKLRSPKRG